LAVQQLKSGIKNIVKISILTLIAGGSILAISAARKRVVTKKVHNISFIGNRGLRGVITLATIETVDRSKVEGCVLDGCNRKPITPNIVACKIVRVDVDAVLAD
jgi:hypothetical protein